MRAELNSPMMYNNRLLSIPEKNSTNYRRSNSDINIGIIVMVVEVEFCFLYTDQPCFGGRPKHCYFDIFDFKVCIL